MATPPEGPALDRQRDTTIDTPASIAHDHTMTPVPGETSLSQLATSTSLVKQVKELEPGEMVGEYRIEGLLGEGGMGRVYSAIHPLIGKKAAVKVLHPRMSANQEVVDRFMQEAKAVNQISHPNIVDIFSFGNLADGQSYFVMECLRGESLQERIRRQPLTRDELCHYVSDISHALEAAHEKGIIHRDLKPENVFLHNVKGDRLQIKLLDFGIAKLANTEDNRIERTRTGAMMGTPKYIAPEQARGYAVDHRVDIYSLGVMMFELAARRLPFVADNAMDLVASHLHDEPPRMSSIVPDIPRILDDVVDAMLSKEAAKRPSLAHLRQVLDEVRTMPPGDASYTVPDLHPPGAVAHSVIATAPVRSRKLPLIAGIAAIGVIGGVIAVTQLGGFDDKPLSPPAVPATKVEVIKADLPQVEIKPAPKVAPVVTTPVTVTLRAGMKGTLVVGDKEISSAPPWKLDLQPGNHVIQFKPARGPMVSRAVTVGGTALTIELTPAPPKPLKPLKPPKPPKPTGDDDFVDPKKTK